MADSSNGPENNSEQKAVQPQSVIADAVKGKAKKTVLKGINKTIAIAVAGALLVGGGWYYKKSSDQSKAEKTAENFIESLTGNKVDLDAGNESINIKDEDTGESVSIESNQKLPSDFPKDDIPYLDEKSVTVVVSTSKDSKKHWSVTTTVEESVDEAASYFEGKIVAPDYTDISSYSYNDTKTYSAKNAGYSVYITVYKSTSDTDTQVTYVIEQQ